MVSFKFSIRALVLCILFVNVIHGFLDDFDTPSGCDVCKIPPVNLTFDEYYGKFQELAHRIWKQNISLTNLGRKYKTIILDQIAKGNQDSFKLSLVSTIAFNYFIPYLSQKPDACEMAEVINGTLPCVLNYDDKEIQHALSQLLKKFYSLNLSAMSTMIFSSGCDFRCGKSPPDPKIKKTSCYKNGFAYPIVQLWNIPKRPYSKISPKLKSVVMDLYNSNNFVDKFLATCTTFSLSEITQRLFAKWDPRLIVEGISLELSDPVPQKCCYARIMAAASARKLKDATAHKTITNEKAYLNTSKCK